MRVSAIFALVSLSLALVVQGSNERFGTVIIETAGTRIPLHVLNKNATGSAPDSFRVDDASADTTPFVVDLNGDVFVGRQTTISTTYRLQVQSPGAGHTGIWLANNAGTGSTAALDVDFSSRANGAVGSTTGDFEIYSSNQPYAVVGGGNNGQLWLWKNGGAVTTLDASNTFLNLNTSGGAQNAFWAIGFGAISTHTNAPAYIAYKQTDTGSCCGLGDLQFYTRNVGTDSAPSVRLTVASDGSVTIPGGLTVGSCSGCGTGTPPGSDTQVLFNDASVFGADADFTWNKTTNMLGVGALTIGATGVSLTTDNDGALTLKSLSAGSAEDLTVNLDDTANTAVWSSSTGLNAWDLSGFALTVASCTGCGGGTASLSTLTAASGTHTIASGNNHSQVWNWALTTDSITAMQFGETTAATAGSGDQNIVAINTLSTSTANALYIKNYGAAHGLRIDDAASDSTAFIVGATGNVCIRCGTEGQEAFNIYNAGSFMMDNGSQNFFMKWNSTVFEIGGTTANSLVLKTNNADRLTIDSAGAITVGGVLQTGGYKSSDGSSGVTGATCSSFKNGICVATAPAPEGVAAELAALRAENAALWARLDALEAARGRR